MNAALAFETQAAFRGILDAHARPGTAVDLAAPAARVADLLGEAPDGAPTLLIAVTLLDASTPFHVAGPDADGVRLTLRRHTYAPHVDLDAAGFVVCTTADAAAPAVNGADPGTLERPERGATVIVPVQTLAGPLPDGHGDATHTLGGPGVDGTRAVRIDAARDALAARDAAPGRYPQGVDLLFVTPAGCVLALPRTTTVAPRRGEKGGT